MTALIFFAAIVAVALIGWAFAELKSKACTYHNDDAELEAQQRVLDSQKANDYTEQDINDVVKSISTKGFDAI